MTKERTTITLDDEAREILNAFDINLSEEVRNLLKNRYQSIDMAEMAREELKRKKERLLKEKQEIEREMMQVEDRIDHLDQIIVKNNVMQEIKNKESHRNLVEEKVAVIRRAKDDGDTEEEIRQYIDKNARVLSERLPYSENELEEILTALVRGWDGRI